MWKRLVSSGRLVPTTRTPRFRTFAQRAGLPEYARMRGASVAMLIGGAVGASVALFAPSKSSGPTKADQAQGQPEAWSLSNNDPAERPDLPTFSLEEVNQHYDEDTGIWVTYRGAVYDVTHFKGHPGGWNRIMMAGGRDLEPFWKVYRLHYRGHIIGLLEKYRIGNLIPEDAAKARDFSHDGGFESDPPRVKLLASNTMAPYCGECRTDLMAESYFTPNELFYVRNHNNVPAIDPEEYELVVSGEGIKTTRFTLKDLKEKFPRYEVVSTIQCAGNRMEDYHGIGKGESKGTFMSPHWSCGAISNAKWAGARMRDILAHCGLDVDAHALGKAYDPDLFHVEFKSIDADETGGNFHASCPFDKVVDPFGDCLVAYEMNDRDIPRDHGYPCRAIVPGVAGARQPKWLGAITVKKQAYGVFQCTQYGPEVTFEGDLANWPPKKQHVLENSGLSRVYGGQTTINDPNRPMQDNVVREMPVQSLISQPPQNGVVGVKDTDQILIKGVAWSGGGCGIKRVDVSLDGGKSFEAAALYKPVIQHPRGQWGWTVFHHRLPIPEEAKAKLTKGETVDLVLTSKALDSHWNVQPETAEANVNARGVAINHWYKVTVTLDPTLTSEQSCNPMQEDGEQGKFANRPSGGQFRVPFDEAGWRSPNGAKGTEGETLEDWVKVSDDGNTQGEPGIKPVVDFDYYRNLKAAPWYAGPTPKPAAQ